MPSRRNCARSANYWRSEIAFENPSAGAMPPRSVAPVRSAAVCETCCTQRNRLFRLRSFTRGSARPANTQNNNVSRRADMVSQRAVQFIHRCLIATRQSPRQTRFAPGAQLIRIWPRFERCFTLRSVLPLQLDVLAFFKPYSRTIPRAAKIGFAAARNRGN